MKKEETVKLGLMPPLTGLVEIYGPEIVWAGKIACQEVNEAGGVLGRPLELIIEDDGSLPESSVAAAEKLVDEHHCSAIIGNLLSNSRISVAYRVAETRKIPYLNFSFYEGSIMSRYFFHFAALPNQQIDKMIPSMMRRHGGSMFFAGNNYEWPRGSIDAAKKALLESGGVILGEEYLPIGASVQEIEDLLDRLEYSGADVFVPYFAGSDQVNLLTRFTERGLKKKMAVVMGHYDEMMASHLPPEVREGFYSSNTYFMQVNTEDNCRYMGRLASLPDVTGIWPDGNGILTNFGEGTYICVKAFAKAANEAGSLEVEKLLAALKNMSLSGPQGTVDMDPETQHAKVNTYLSRCTREGRFEIIEEFGAIAPLMPQRYRHMRISTKTSIEDDLRLHTKMMESMNEGILLEKLETGDIIYVSAGFEKMFGYKGEEIIGKPLPNLISSSGGKLAEDNEKIIREIVRKKGHWEGETEITGKDGRRFWVETNITTFTHAEYGEVLMGVLRDITERKKYEESLRVAKEEAERANASKSTFLATMSHEIRTPLNSIIGLSEVLMESRLDGEQRRLMQTVNSAGENLLYLINDILDLSRIESGSFNLEEKPFILADQVENAVSIASVKAREKGIAVKWHVEDYMPERVLGDPARLRQILMNLLGNAIKFTEKGTVSLNVSQIKGDDGRKRLLFSVSDEGIGIEKSQHQYIFEPFRQSDSSITRRFGGTGLGLAISKKIVNMMGGEMCLESEPGKGSTFYFTADLAEYEKEIHQKTFEGLRVLVFGCNRDFNERVSEIFSEEGAIVKDASSEKEALSAISGAGESPFSIIVGCCDAELDSGCVFGEKVRAIPVIPQPAILLCVEGTICRKIERGIAAGIRCGMLMPLHKKELVSEAIAAMEEAGKIKHAQEAGAGAMNILLVDDSKDNRMLITTFLKNTPHNVVSAESGREAIEHFKQASFDLVLMDIQMPDMDGYTATREIRKWESEQGRKATPIIALTAHAFIEDKGKSTEAGCTEHVTKPIKKARLLDLVAKYGTK